MSQDSEQVFDLKLQVKRLLDCLKSFGKDFSIPLSPPPALSFWGFLEKSFQCRCSIFINLYLLSGTPTDYNSHYSLTPPQICVSVFL